MSFLLSDLKPISITLSNDYERLVSSRFCAFMESEGVFLRHQCAYRKGLGTCDALLDMYCAVKAAMNRGMVDNGSTV